MRGRLVIRDDRSFHGTKMTAVYLELENTSDVADPIEFYFDPMRSVTSTVTDGRGRPLAEPPNGADIVSPPPYWIALPSDGFIRFKVSVSGYGVYENSGTQVQMPTGDWIIKPRDKGKYYLAATLNSKPPSGDKRRAWSGSLVLPKVLIPH
jgi:hypothetical protein